MAHNRRKSVRIVHRSSTKTRKNARGVSKAIVLPKTGGSVRRPQRLAKFPWWENRRSDSLSLFWWHSHTLRGSNFGDALSPVIVSRLSGKQTTRTDASPKLVAVGSVLKFAKNGDTVWGSGFPSGDQSCERGAKVLAVRGPLTRERLLKLGIPCPEVYGDPALLLPHLFQVPDEKKHRHRIGVIPHYMDHDRATKMLRGSEAKIIDLLAPIEQVIRDINACDVIYSSSLHGVIVAEAYGIPSVWVEFSDSVRGGGWKFRDYYAMTSRHAEALNWRKGVLWSDPTLDVPEFDLEPLYDAFPHLPENAPSLAEKKVVLL